MKERNKTITTIAVLFISMLLLGSLPAMAFDASTPASYTVNYILGVDTTFTVAVVGSQSSMDFHPANANSQIVEPSQQVKATSTAWAVITNAGNVVQTFSVNLTTSQDSHASVNISNTNVFTQQILLSNTAQTPTGWTSIATSGTANLYALANFTNLPGGTTSKTLQINSVQS